MNFWDEVYILREQGMIPKVWTRACLRPHLQGKYMPNSISTIPSNGSMTRDGKEMGNYVKRGQDAKAWRVGTGEFQLVVDPDDDEVTRESELQRAKSYAHVERRKAAGDPYPLRGLPLRYDRPFDPVALEDWEALK